MSAKLGFFLLKAGNLALITIYSFSIVYILIRVVGQASYPLVVSTAAIGNYVVATDLGYSGYLYYDTRRSFIQSRLAERDAAISEAVSLYFSLAALGGIGGAIVILVAAHVPFHLRLALALFFISVVLPLPWLLLRKIAAAIDYYMEFEICELLRRASFLGLSLAMLAGLPFLAFSALCLFAWTLSFTVAIVMLARRGLRLRPATPAAMLRHLRQNRPGIIRSGALSMLEFLIYNYPYICIPLLFRGGSAVIAFDLFYKISRFGALSYGVPAEAALPHQTRAFYTGRWREVLLYFGGIIGIEMIIFACAAAVILGAGGPMFTALLSKGGIVTPAIRLAMTGMLGAMIFQVAAGSMLINTGLQGRLAQLSLISCALMALLVVMVAVARWPFPRFLGGYVAVYWLHTVLYLVCFAWFMARSRRLGAANAEVPAAT